MCLGDFWQSPYAQDVTEQLHCPDGQITQHQHDANSDDGGEPKESVAFVKYDGIVPETPT